ncbi:dialkylresorcinol condensing enzyme DarA [Flavobacterium sp. Sd200]|uniref:dialkylrecorsinol condensing enzyme DarA n=1 Tax=Flavobacterium sp. Sd200 TaxID=2692211 RepID=UPI00136931A0|nr:dialkylrecorsinol condensing enzyme DarA [Flavobacterium sp. Sd200]MXN89998.1 dialkylresorcinol condensing enzyme DarA [Flavobacterium sp. Sd200]
MKNVLVIYFTQSGQLHDIAQNIAAPFIADPGVNVVFHRIEMEQPFPFPWNKEQFFDAFPESFLQIPAKLKPVPQHVLDVKYDLVLFHYQVWFLSPSIPINSFLKSPEAKLLLNNTPVVTISGSRNMWFLAQEKIKVLLKQNGALLKGNIALTDRAGNLISVITIVEWMFSGKKTRHLGIFPLPGVSDKDITESEKFGLTIHHALLQDDFSNLQDKLLVQGAVRVNTYLVGVDTKGNYIFSKWSAFISKNPEKRKKLLKIFVVYLVLAIWVISPIVYILHLIMYPFNFNKNKRIIKYYKGVESA